jgi:hypothetical protein
MSYFYNRKIKFAKFNPNHDEKGRFSEGDGGSGGSDSSKAVLNLNRVKRITSHAGHARFLAETDGDDPIGYIPRQPNIPSPYHFSERWAVWSHGGKPVVIVETAHKRYDVFEVPASAVTKR